MDKVSEPVLRMYLLYLLSLRFKIFRSIDSSDIFIARLRGELLDALAPSLPSLSILSWRWKIHFPVEPCRFTRSPHTFSTNFGQRWKSRLAQTRFSLVFQLFFFSFFLGERTSVSRGLERRRYD